MREAKDNTTNTIGWFCSSRRVSSGVLFQGYLFMAMMNVFTTALFGLAALYAGEALGDDFAPFFTIPDAPKILILNGEIDLRTPLAFRRALEANPLVTVVALNSPGGSVQPALLIAEEVHDRKLITFVPESGSCASACSFIFFAGSGRYAAGKLGVHQIYGTNDVEATQLNLSDIIETLAKYDVAPAVITKMLRTPSNSMYFFSKEELGSLGIQADVPSEDTAMPKTSRPATRQPAPVPASVPGNEEDASQEGPARKAILDLIASSSWDADQALAKASTSYSGFVDFYGKKLTRDDVLRDKIQYMARWPVRSVQPRDESILVGCDQNVCSISGIYDWAVSNPLKNKRISGVSKFFYQLQMSNPPQVIKENGIVIERNR